ncbi:DUF2157 domain-containing protein [Testudinibacter sp. P27/CKL/0425]
MEKLTKGDKMPNRTLLFTASWERYLLILSVLITAGFLSSGVVTWIAANWDQFGKFSKLYATQGLLVFSVLAGLVAYAREYRKVGKVRLKFATATLFFIAAVLIGALLALIGQIYQTGADPWQLFALWTLLQLPLLLALPNVAAALLLILTANTALWLYLDFISVYEINHYPLIGLNLLFVLVAERFAKPLHDLLACCVKSQQRDADWHAAAVLFRSRQTDYTHLAAGRRAAVLLQQNPIYLTKAAIGRFC